MIETKQKLKAFGALFDETFKIFAADWLRFAKMIVIGVLGAVPIVLILGLFFLGAIIFKDLGGVFLLVAIVLGLAGIAAVLFSIYVSVISQVGRYNLLKDRAGNVWEIFKNSRKSFWGFFWISILTGILIVLWTFAFIVPGIIFGVYYSLSLYVFIFEGKTGCAAIKRSQELINGYWWAFFGRMLLFSLIIMVGYMILAAIVGLPKAVTPDGSAIHSMASVISGFFGVILNSFVIPPLVLIFAGLIYKDLTAIKGAAANSTASLSPTEPIKT